MFINLKLDFSQIAFSKMDPLSLAQNGFQAKQPCVKLAPTLQAIITQPRKWQL